MTKKKIKKLILRGDKLSIQQAIFDYWKLADRPMPQLPYKND